MQHKTVYKTYFMLLLRWVKMIIPVNCSYRATYLPSGMLTGRILNKYVFIYVRRWQYEAMTY